MSLDYYGQGAVTDPFDADYYERMEAESAARAARAVARAEAAKPIEDPAQLPHLLNGAALPDNADDMAKAMARGPILLADMWGKKVERIKPTLMEIEDEERCVFYRGKSNTITGEPGKGKTLFAQTLVRDEARAGRWVMFIDYEKDVMSFVERMQDVGTTVEDAAHILYWRPSVALAEGVVQTIEKYVRQIGLDVVVIDSVSRAMSRAGLDENSNKEVRTWYETGPERILLAGGTPISIDHTKRAQQGADGKTIASQDRFAKGAAAKLEVVTGIAILVKTGIAFSKSQAGKATFVCAKDNNGGWAEGEVMCDAFVTPGDNGEIVVELKKTKSQVATEEGLKWRPTGKMEQVCRELSLSGKALAMADLKRLIQGKAEYVVAAVDRLAEEGYVSAPPAGRGLARNVTLIEMFVEANDPGADNSPAAKKKAAMLPLEGEK